MDMEERVRIDLTFGFNNPKLPFTCESQVDIINGAAIGELHHRANCYSDNWCRLRENKYSEMLSSDDRSALDTSCGTGTQKEILNKIYIEHGIIAIKVLYDDGWVYYGRYLKEIIVENLDTIGIDDDTLDFIKYLTQYKSMSHSSTGIKETDKEYITLLRYMFNDGIDVGFVMNPSNHKSWLDEGNIPYAFHLKELVAIKLYGNNNLRGTYRLQSVELEALSSIKKLEALKDTEPQLFI